MVDAIALRKNTKLPASVCNLPHLTDFTSLRFFACTFPRVLYARIYVVSTSNRARCNINRFHESIGSLGSLCRSLYRRTHVALRCTTRSTDPLVRLWPRKENYVHTYLPRAAETQISFYLLPFLFLSFSLFSFFLWGGGGGSMVLLVDFGFRATIREPYERITCNRWLLFSRLC